MPSDAKKQRDKAKKEKEKAAAKQRGGKKNPQSEANGTNEENNGGGNVQNGLLDEQELDAVMDVLHKVELDNAKARAVAGVLTSQVYFKLILILKYYLAEKY